MKRKVILMLIAHIILCLSGMLTAILGFAEMFGELFTDIAEIPFHIAVPLFLSGSFTFITAFINGMDYKYWQKLDK